MSFEEILSADLPPPRDDEPESLRQDILDELADHLACSYRRELLSGADAESARRRTLERFGNPAAIAARLWFDAMKGRIMSQRILATACVLLAISCVFLGGMSWLQWDRMSRIQAEQLAASQAAQNVMLKQMQALTKAVEHPRSPDWNPASFKLTEEALDGPPAVGVKVMFGLGYLSNNSNVIQRLSDQQGMVDLGAVQPGEYHYQIGRSMDDPRGNWSTEGTVQVRPYQTLVKPIVCPAAKMDRLPVRVAFNWPEELKQRGITVHARFGRLKRKLGEDTIWSFQQFGFTASAGFGGDGELRRKVPLQTWLDLLFESSKPQAELLQSTAPFFYMNNRAVAEGRRWASTRNRRLKPIPLTIGRVFAMVNRPDVVQIENQAYIFEGEYSLMSLEVLRSRRTEATADLGGGKNDTAEPERYDVLAIASPFRLFNDGKPEWVPDPTNQMHANLVDLVQSVIELSGDEQKTFHRGWQAERGKVNTWIIEPPNSLFEAVQANLKFEEEAKTKKPEAPKPANEEAAKPKR